MRKKRGSRSGFCVACPMLISEGRWPYKTRDSRSGVCDLLYNVVFRGVIGHEKNRVLDLVFVFVLYQLVFRGMIGHKKKKVL